MPIAAPSTAATMGLLLFTSDRRKMTEFCGRRLQKISDIVARGEHPRTTGYDETANFGIGLRRVDRIAHRMIHFLRQRILLFRSSHGNRAGGAFVGNNDVLGHAYFPRNDP